MPTKLLPPGAAVRMPWKNGRGTTLELASDATVDRAWTWRLSIADVPEDGPFSRFEGCERVIACLEGNGMRIVTGGTRHDVPRTGAGVSFSGDAETSGQLVHGPCRDVNLMYRRDEWSGNLTIVRGLPDALPPAECVVVHLVDGSCAVNGHDLACGATIVIEGEPVRLVGRGVMIVACLARRVTR